MKKTVLAILMMIAALPVLAQRPVAGVIYQTEKDVSYTAKTDAYARERLKVDVYYPETLHDCPVVVWFHGGGLTGGQKELPAELKEKGMVIVGVNYRLLPKVKIDACLDDAAEAVAWTFRHAADYHGDVRKIFVSGHSAGGYLTMMLGLDRKWLGKYSVDADSICGLIPFSGQTISHFAYRDMNGRGNLQPLVDEYAPLYWVRNLVPPMVLVTGDRNEELFGRYEENAYFWRMLKLCGHEQTYLYELDGYNHGDMVRPAFHILLNHVDKILKTK
ncbi:MAG: alpha/beta hydrolase [Prevotella sp.]|nr:alpha/beta hydrolase [Prevotella sp.]